MKNRSKILPKTVIVIMTIKKTFMLFEMVGLVRIRCHVKFELTVFAGKNATCAVVN